MKSTQATEFDGRRPERGGAGKARHCEASAAPGKRGPTVWGGPNRGPSPPQKSNINFPCGKGGFAFAAWGGRRLRSPEGGSEARTKRRPEGREEGEAGGEHPRAPPKAGGGGAQGPRAQGGRRGEYSPRYCPEGAEGAGRGSPPPGGSGGSIPPVIPPQGGKPPKGAGGEAL